ncbi:MAG TPA: LysR family transcriptional regulator [Ramlibacter sp.]|nr:LysR family transcriptional regulator [Ramlibacter sp.]
MPETAAHKLNTIVLFCKAAEMLNFSAAAEQAGTTPSAISKAVRRLENQLGVKLFERNTRAIRLTEEGRGFYETCRQALDSIEQAELALTQGQRRPRGTLRLSLPSSYGILHVVPRIPEYTQRHGHEVKVVVSLTNSITGFISEGCDVAVRLGRIADSRLVARPLHEAHYCVAASPAYLRRHGTPRKPEDLHKHQAIHLVMSDTGRVLPWQFRDGKRDFDVAVPSSLTVDHPLAALSAANGDGGLVRLLDFTLVEELRTGRLVEVLGGFRPEPVPVSIVYPSRRHLSAKVRSFVEFLLQERELHAAGPLPA